MIAYPTTPLQKHTSLDHIKRQSFTLHQTHITSIKMGGCDSCSNSNCNCAKGSCTCVRSLAFFHSLPITSLIASAEVRHPRHLWLLSYDILFDDHGCVIGGTREEIGKL